MFSFLLFFLQAFSLGLRLSLVFLQVILKQVFPVVAQFSARAFPLVVSSSPTPGFQCSLFFYLFLQGFFIQLLYVCCGHSVMLYSSSAATSQFPVFSEATVQAADGSFIPSSSHLGKFFPAGFFIQLCPAFWSFASASTVVRLSPQQKFFALGLCPRLSLMRSFSHVLSHRFSELRSFSLGVPCGSGSFLCSVQWGTGFFWFSSSNQSGSLGVSCGEKSSVLLSLAVWTSARRLFLLTGESLLRKGLSFFFFSGDFSSLPSEPGVFLAFGNLAQSPVRVKSADGIWHSQMSLLLRKAALVASLCVTSSPAAPWSCF